MTRALRRLVVRSDHREAVLGEVAVQPDEMGGVPATEESQALDALHLHAALTLSALQEVGLAHGAYLAVELVVERPTAAQNPPAAPEPGEGQGAEGPGQQKG